MATWQARRTGATLRRSGAGPRAGERRVHEAPDGPRVPLTVARMPASEPDLAPAKSRDHSVAGQGRRLRQALSHSLAGLRDAWREPACRLEVLALVVAIPIAAWLPVTALEKLVLVGSVVAVLVVELLNTAIEAAVDRIGAERHELSRAAKDLGSAAVLVAAVLAAVVWAVIALPRLVAG